MSRYKTELVKIARSIEDKYNQEGEFTLELSTSKVNFLFQEFILDLGENNIEANYAKDFLFYTADGNPKGFLHGAAIGNPFKAMASTRDSFEEMLADHIQDMVESEGGLDLNL